LRHSGSDLAHYRRELDELQTLLNGRVALAARAAILPFFWARRHLSAFIGAYFPCLARPDRLAIEYDLFGDFICDLILGDSATGQ